MAGIEPTPPVPKTEMLPLHPHLERIKDLYNIQIYNFSKYSSGPSFITDCAVDLVCSTHPYATQMNAMIHHSMCPDSHCVRPAARHSL